MNNLLKLCCISGALISSAFADQYKVDVSKINIDQKTEQKIGARLFVEADGNIYGYFLDPLTHEVSINKISFSTNKLISLGAPIPHPDTKTFDYLSTNLISYANKSGTLILTYLFRNEQNKYQHVFYTLKNNKWTRLSDFTDKSGDITSISKVFIDENNNAYFYTLTNKFYALVNGSWQQMENPANDPQSKLNDERTFSIANNAIYTTRVDINGSKQNTNVFNVFKYDQNSVQYTSNILLTENEYAPSCSTVLPNGTVMTGFVSNHANLVKQSLKIQVLTLNQSMDYPYKSKVTNDGSLFGSIVALGQSVTNLAKSVSSSNESNNVVQPVTIAEIDLNPYLYGNDVDVANRISCTTIGKVSYFILKSYGNSNTPQYIYFKITPQ